MTWLFRLAFRGQYHHIAHMRAEIAWLRDQMTYERDRADRAVDTILRWRAEVNGITPPPAAATPEAVQAQLASVFNSPEIAAMGLVDGV